MKKLLVIGTLFLSVLFMSIGSAHAQFQQTPRQCDQRSKVVGLLAKKYKEQPVAMGVSSTGGLVEVLTSRSGTWTIIITTPKGMSCFIAAGEGWRTKEITEPKGDEIRYVQ